MPRTDKFRALRARRNPEAIITEAFSQLEESESVKYLVGSMQPVDASYTQRTYGEADRVFNQVLKGLERNSLSAEKSYQGSVTKGTHIKAYSDIDLLVVEKRFFTVQHPQTVASPYEGDPVKDLLQIRSIAASSLSSAFPEATVSTSGPRSIKISGGSLLRTVDVVPCNWWNTNDYARYGSEVYRGIHILNADVPEREEDQPFLQGGYLETKDKGTNGNTRKLIRMLKSLKYDSEGSVSMSSFDIEGIVYRMNDTQMQWSLGDEILLAVACRDWLRTIEQSDELRASLTVPDGKRLIFSSGHATLAQLSALRRELEQVLTEIQNDLAPRRQTLTEARVHWPGLVSRPVWH
jgi:hypothetical protein